MTSDFLSHELENLDLERFMREALAEADAAAMASRVESEQKFTATEKSFPAT